MISMKKLMIIKDLLIAKNKKKLIILILLDVTNFILTK
jgi:hypothetical protein